MDLSGLEFHVGSHYFQNVCLHGFRIRKLGLGGSLIVQDAVSNTDYSTDFFLNSVIFPQVKHLTRDWRTTAYALRHSTLLELNDEGRKVRRRLSVPVFASESLPSRMLLLSELQSWPELAVLEGGAGDCSEGGATQQEQLMKL